MFLVMTYCQVHGLPAVFYTCYTESVFLDILSMKEFTEICTVTPFKDIYVVS